MRNLKSYQNIHRNVFKQSQKMMTIEVNFDFFKDNYKIVS